VRQGASLSESLGNGTNVEADVFLRHKLRHRVAVSLRVAPVRDRSGQISGAIEVFSDATAKVQAEKRTRELEETAFRDSLTSLSNRRYTELKVKKMIEERFQFGRSAGRLMLDIDDFKRVNDTCGHHAGDQVFGGSGIHSGGELAQARSGEPMGRRRISRAAAGRHSRKSSLPCRTLPTLVEASRILYRGQAVSVTISVGATLVSKRDSVASIVKRVDQLLYESKARGRNRTSIG
jgi:PleD family two-component response regulator